MSIRDKIAQALHDAPTRNYGLQADAIIAALPDMVPELVWEGSPQTSIVSQGKMHWFEVYPKNVGRYILDDGESYTSFATLSEAKAAANKHHRAQIMKGLGLDTD